MPQITANAITINYALEEPPASTAHDENNNLVVLVNGLADDRTSWSLQIPALLQAGYRVLSYDHRGIGRSSAPPGPYTAALLAADLAALLAALAVERAHFVGVSMGGMVVQAYALGHGRRGTAPGTGTGTGTATGTGTTMLSATLACTYAAPGPFCGRMFARWADVARRMSVGDVMSEVLLWSFTPAFFARGDGEEAGAVEDAARRAVSGMRVETYLAQLHVIQTFDSAGALEGLREEGRGLGGLEPGKVLVLAGRTDILIPVTLSRGLAERIEGCRWKTVKGGHGCMWEFPESFNDTLIEFLNECAVDPDTEKSKSM